MKLSELILAVGDENVRFQNLDQCMEKMDFHITKGTRIVFGTEEKLTPEGMQRLGLVVWLPRDAVKTAMAATPAEQGGAENE